MSAGIDAQVGARRVMTRHEMVARALVWDEATSSWAPGEPVRPWCYSPDHEGPSGVPWPCDAVTLARLILEDQQAGE